MTTSAVPSYAGYRFPAEVISHAVWLRFRFPLSLRMVHELLATRGIIVSYETVRQWAELTYSCSAATTFQPSSIEQPASKPFWFGPRSSASPLQRNHEHAVLIARQREPSPTS